MTKGTVKGIISNLVYVSTGRQEGQGCEPRSPNLVKHGKRITANNELALAA